MRKRILIYLIVLIIIAVTITGFFISQFTQKYYKYEEQDKLTTTATLLQFQISEELKKGNSIDYNDYAVKYASIMDNLTTHNSNSTLHNIRITFINTSGQVLGESDTNYIQMENHLDRIEVQQALNGKLGIDTRYSNTLNTQFMYAALLISPANVIVRVSTPLIKLKDIDKIILNYTIIGIIAGLLLTFILAIKFSSYVTNPIDKRLNAMNIELEKTVGDLLDKSVKVDAMIDSMVNGIVAVDNKFKVMLINAKACEIFGIKNGPGVIGINIIELIRNHTINSFLTETVQSNISHASDIPIGNPTEKTLRVYTSPIKSKDNISINSGGILLIEDITNIKKLEQIRTDFVSNVTHELKTPLTSIRGFIETLKGGAIEDTTVAKTFLDIIDIEAERLYMLINDILQLSEIENKHTDSNIAKHNLNTIIEEIKPILQDVAQKKNVTLNWDIDEKVTIVANKDKIKQMLINLIDNGIKYNVEGGSVSIKSIKSGGKIIISVKDTGIGIAPEHISRIFERFYRVDKGRSRNMGGTGLGLSIVKHIVNLYNGDINVSSSPGKGTEFIIRLPA